MGFSNEYLTEQEIELIKETEHKALVNKHNGVFCYVNKCTTDRERKIWLVHYPRSMDCESVINEERFVLFYGAISKQNMIEISLLNLDIEKNPSIKEEHNAKLITYWKIKEIMISPSLTVDLHDIKEVLNEIMDVYGINGDPMDREKEYFRCSKAIIRDK